jgi:O-antigen ligase
MTAGPDRNAALWSVAASFCLGVALPILMAPASKSSPLLLAIATVLSVMALWRSDRLAPVISRATGAARAPGAILSIGLLSLMAISMLWAHDRASSANQFLQFILPVIFGVFLALAFPVIADSRRTAWWLAGAAIAALIMAIDLKTGLMLRKLTGGRVVEFSYNRGLVTLVVLAWPLLALAQARGRIWWGLALLAIPPAVLAGESQTAVLGMLVGLAIFPVAWLAPRLTRRAGLLAMLVVLATAPLIGTIASKALGAGFHKTFAAGHSDDRVEIWLSFEAATHQHWISGNGFGSTLNMQKAPVAAEVPPERVLLLGAGHPHNAFLQLWAELGLVGAILAALLAIRLFDAVGRLKPLLQPFVLTWIAVISAIALVSHGAWQAWWIAAIAASAAGFLAIERELRADEAAATPL